MEEDYQSGACDRRKTKPKQYSIKVHRVDASGSYDAGFAFLSSAASPESEHAFCKNSCCGAHD